MIFKLSAHTNFKTLARTCYETYDGTNEKHSYDSESGIPNVGHPVQKKIVPKYRKI